MSYDSRDRLAGGAAFSDRDSRIFHVARFAKIAPCKSHVDETQHRSKNSGAAVTEHESKGSERRAERDTEIRRSRQPAECFRAIIRLGGIRDVRLNHADSSTAGPLHDAR